MRRAVTNMPRRALRTSPKVARSSKEAAIQLVRLEFDAARLQSGIAQAQMRVDGYQSELVRNEEHRRSLLALLSK